MPNSDWRIIEMLKSLRQCVTCPFCGSLVSTAEGYNIHADWHSSINNKVANIDHKFDVIDDYVRNPVTGLEKRLQDLVDAANSSIATLRSDTTAAISADRARLSAIETEITKPNTGIRARLTRIESVLGIVLPS